MVLRASSASITTLPPSPPSPPSGPPRGTYFSRRKLRQPLPPLPAKTLILASSTNFIWFHYVSGRDVCDLLLHASISKFRRGQFQSISGKLTRRMKPAAFQGSIRATRLGLPRPVHTKKSP